MRKLCDVLGVGVVSLSLCACGTIMPITQVDSSSVAAVGAALEKRADEYQQASSTWGNSESWNNIPLILLGTGGVAAAAFASGAAKGNLVVGLALAAGVWALGYSTFAPEVRQDAYSSAASQLSCLAQRSKSVDSVASPGLKQSTQDLAIEVNSLSQRINALNALRLSVRTPLPDASQQNEVTIADARVASAGAVLDHANAELDASGSIPITLKNMLYAIDRKTQLAARSKVLTVADVNGALAKPGVVPVAGATGSEKPGGAAFTTTTAGVTVATGPIKDYVDGANKLDQVVDPVTRNSVVTNKTYTGALASFKQCTTD